MMRLYLQNILRILTLLIASIATNLVCPKTFSTWIMQWPPAWSTVFTLAPTNYSPHSSWPILLIYGRPCHSFATPSNKYPFIKNKSQISEKKKIEANPDDLTLHYLSNFTFYTLLLCLYLLQSSFTVLSAFPKHQRHVP